MSSAPDIERDGKDPRYASVARRMWNDRGFMDLSAAKPNAQTLLVRLLTGPEGGSIPGVIAVGEAALAEALGWPLAGFRRCFSEIERKGMAIADWRSRLVFLPKAAKHKQNQPTSPNVIISWKRQWAELPECNLKAEAYHTLRAMVEGLGDGKNEAWLDAFDKSCTEPTVTSSWKSLGNPSGNPSPESSAKTIGNHRSGIRDQGTGGESAPRGTRLPEDWTPPSEVLLRFRKRERVDANPSVEFFRNHWLSSTGRNAVKTRWDLAFINWVLKDIADGRCPPAGDEELPLLRLPHRAELLQHDLANAPDMTGASLGSSK